MTNNFLKIHKNDILIMIGLFCLGIISRYIFRGDILYHWDSINFAYGIQEFNVAKGQPHVPGYILYVYLTKLVDIFFADAQITITTISCISSGLAIAWLYLLGKDMFNQRVGLYAAFFLASSPLFWFYGEIALPHSLDTLGVILAAWLLYKLRQGHTQYLVPCAVWLGIAGGMRPQTQVFLAPLILFAGWPLLWKRAFIAVAVVGVIDLLWFVPLLWLNGGPDAYFATMGAFSDRFQTTTNVLKGAGWFGFTRNVTKLALYTLYAWSLPLIPVILAEAKLLYTGQFRTSAFIKDNRLWFATLWIAPSFIYYLLIHMGQQGLVFVYLPMLLLLSAVAVDYLTEAPLTYRQMGMALLVLGNCIIFVLLPTYPLGSTSPKLLTVETLRRHDSYYQNRFDTINQEFPANNTVILATNWRFPQYYLPEYSLRPYTLISKRELGAGAPVVGKATLTATELGITPTIQGDVYVVIFDNDILPFNQSADRIKTTVMPNGEQLSYLQMKADEHLYVGPDAYWIME